MKDQAKTAYGTMVGDLNNLVKDIHDAIKAKDVVEPQAATLYFGVQQLVDNLPSPPTSLDSLIAAALSVSAFFEQSQRLIAQVDPGKGTIYQDCRKAQTEAQIVLDDAYKHPAASDELSFAELQVAVDKLEAHFNEDHVSKKLTDANKSLKALQETGFQPTQEQLRAYTAAWFDVTTKLDATAGKKGKQQEHIATLIDIRDELSTVTNRLGVLAETSVGVDIPEF